MFTAHATCARSAATIALDGVPLTVMTVVVSQPVRRALGHPLLEERRSAGALGEALHEHGAPAHRAHQRLGDGDVVADEVELGLAPLGEEHLVRAGDPDLAPGQLEHLGVVGAHAGTPLRRSCTKRTTIAPSPTAVAQRLTEPERTSPAA